MNVPKLRFPEFEGEWEERKIQEFLDSGILLGHLDGNHGELYPSSDEFASEGVPYVSANDLIDGAVDFSRSKRLPEKRANQFKKGIAKTGDVLFAHNATVGPTAILSTDLDFVILSTTVTYYRFDSNRYDSHFAFHALNSDRFVRQYSRVMSQSTRNQVPITMQRKFWLPVASLPEQKKIAAFLGVVDAKIAALRERRAGLERYKRGLMQALFSQTLRFTKPDGSAFPDWEEKRLGEVFGWAKTNSLSRENLNYEGGEAQNIHYGDIHTKFKATFRQSQEHVPFVSAGAVPKGFSEEEFCQIGDVVIADASEDYADIGKAIEIVELGEKPLVAGLHTYIARPKGRLALGFSGYLLRSATMRRQIMRIAQGISVLGISKTNLEKLVLQLPHPDEQARIAEALSAMDAKIAAVGDQVAQMEAFKKGLLQQMFV